MTEQELKDLVRKAEERFQTLSPEEKRAHHREQAISFVYGNLMDCNPRITREEVARIYDETH